MKFIFTDKIMAICIALTTALCISSCKEKGPKTTKLQIIYTTDVHGRILDTDFMHHDKEMISLANMMTYVEEARNDASKELILLDNGDLLQGDPSMYYYNVEAIRDEHLAVRAMNYIGYDAINIGNHDFECGEGIYYDHFSKQTNATVLGANCIDSRTQRPMFAPYTIIERNGFKIAVLGITHSGTPQWLPKSMYPHIEFGSMTQATLDWVPRIIRSEEPDLMVVMFHAGGEQAEFIDTRSNMRYTESIEQIIAQTHSIDLVLIGHDHKWGIRNMIDADGDCIPVVQPKSHAEQYATIDITLTQDVEGNHSFKIEQIKLNDCWRLPPNEAFAEAFSDATESVDAYLNTPLGALADTLDGKGTLVGQTNLMDFIHEVQLSRTGADISMASAMSSFADIPAGDISMRQLFDLYKYENQIDKIWMTGEDVKKFLEYGYGKQFAHMKSNKDHLLNYITDENGDIQMGPFGPELATPQYNFTSAAGINYIVDVTKPAGERVTIESMADGTPFSMERRYIVAISSFQASGGGGFVTKGLGWDEQDIRYHSVTESTKDMRYFIAQHIRKHGIVKSQRSGHWKVVPSTWWDDNKDRDVEILLPYLKH